MGADLTGLKVVEVMSREVMTSSSDSSISDIAKVMSDKRVGSVVVTENNKAVGIVTEQDIVRKVVVNNKDPKNSKAGDIMDKKLISVSSNEDIYDVMVVMKNNEIKHLPVIDDTELVGIITAKDIIRIKPYLIEMLTFKSSLSTAEAKDLFEKF